MYLFTLIEDLDTFCRNLWFIEIQGDNETNVTISDTFHVKQIFKLHY